jgi:hypothetical protein
MEKNYNDLYGSQEIADLQVQKTLVNHYFPFVTTSIINKTLLCHFEIIDKSLQQIYKVGIFYKSNLPPQTFILEPNIKSQPAIHMYENSSLCLYYPYDYIFNKRFCIALEIIPWTIKWIYCYETFKVNGGTWLGNEALHSSEMYIALRRKSLVEKL